MDRSVVISKAHNVLVEALSRARRECDAASGLDGANKRLITSEMQECVA